jgi:hypothetical protein
MILSPAAAKACSATTEKSDLGAARGRSFEVGGTQDARRIRTDIPEPG